MIARLLRYTGLRVQSLADEVADLLDPSVLRAERDKAEEEAQRWRQDCDSALEEYDRLASAHAETQAELGAARAACVELEDRVRELEDHASGLREELKLANDGNHYARILQGLRSRDHVRVGLPGGVAHFTVLGNQVVIAPSALVTIEGTHDDQEVMRYLGVAPWRSVGDSLLARTYVVDSLKAGGAES